MDWAETWLWLLATLCAMCCVLQAALAVLCMADPEGRGRGATVRYLGLAVMSLGCMIVTWKAPWYAVLVLLLAGLVLTWLELGDKRGD